MSVALQELQIRGAFVPKDLEPADRARNWFWENGRPSDSKYSPSIPVKSDRIQPPFHHLDFLDNPFTKKTSAPAEVSLWFAFTNHRGHIFHRFSQPRVITSQATKLIDTLVYLGPEAVLKHSRTELRDAIVGYVA